MSFFRDLVRLGEQSRSSGNCASRMRMIQRAMAVSVTFTRGFAIPMRTGCNSPAHRHFILFGPLLLFWCCSLSPGFSASTPEALVGVSGTTITPKVGSTEMPVWIAGYSHGRQATGIHDDLWSRCLVVTAGTGSQQKTVALVSLDLIGYHYPEVLKIRRGFHEKYPEMKVDHLLVACTHVHEGPDAMGLWGKTVQQSGINSGYLEFVNASVVDTVAAAYRQRKPAQIRFGSAETHGYQVDIRLPQVKDETVLFMHAEDRNGKTIGTLVNWSSHPEVLGGDNTLITADYPYYLRQAIEKMLGGTTIFFVGSIGGLLTSEGAVVEDPATLRPAEEHSWRKAQIVGEGVAEVVLAAIPKAKPVPIERVDIRSKVIYLPLTNPHFRLASGLHLMPRQLFTNGQVDFSVEPGEKWGVTFDVPIGKEIQTEIDTITLGPAQILGVPGEIYPELVNGGIQNPQESGADFPGAAREEPPLRALMQGRYKLVFGLANDEVGYIIPKSQWDEKPPYAYGRKESQYGEINSCGHDTAPSLYLAFRELLAGK